MKACLHMTSKRAYIGAMTTPIITKSQAVAAYDGNASALARALGVTPSAVNQWPEGPINERWALKLAFILKPTAFTALWPED